MTKQNVIELLKENIVDKGAHPQYDVDYNALLPKYIVNIAQQVGGEDQGSNYYVVLKLKSKDEMFYVKCEGRYDSDEGVNWEYGDVFEVEPKSKKITVYEKV